MNYVFKPLTLLLLLASLYCNTQTNNQNVKPLKDGIYIILNSGDSTLTSSEGIIINFSHYFLGDNTDGQPTKLEIDTTEFVSLILQQRPDSIMQKDGRMNLLLSMTPDAGQMLEDFTGRNVKKRVAMIVGGEAVSKHKIREKIIGGKLQITRCTDNACEFLYYELMDNVIEVESIEPEKN